MNDSQDDHAPGLALRARVARWACSLALVFAGCRSYDAGLLDAPGSCGNGQLDAGETCDVAIAAGAPGACPELCDSDDACAPAVLIGSGCQQRCSTLAITEARNADGCCPEGADGADDDDCTTCGDGFVGPGETCDPPEQCLSAQKCIPPATCIMAKLSGSAESCNTRCDLTLITSCHSGDDCCPAGCTQANDSDCSASCGDGILDPAVETCEPDSEDRSCPVDCDDGDPCTVDLMTGSAENCNIACTHTSISAPKNGDGCCPKGGNARNDDDCQPRCGNGVREAGEECDGGPDCSDRCTLTQLGQCRDALATIDAMSSACKTCACERCSDTVLACHHSGDEAADAACHAVIACTQRTGCRNGTCYCGSSFNCALPDGVCREPIEEAANSTLPARVLACANDADCPAARAYAQDSCVQHNCTDVCGRAAR